MNKVEVELKLKFIKRMPCKGRYRIAIVLSFSYVQAKANQIR